MKISRYKEFIKEDATETIQKFVNVDGVKFYHGTLDFEIKSAKDINPLFRDSIEYKKNQENPMTRRKSTSCDYGTGIYFGRTTTEVNGEDSKAYFDPDVHSGGEHTRGFLYEMTLKPGAKVIMEGSPSVHKRFAIHYSRITKEDYNDLISKGVDAVSQYGGSIVLLNPDAIDTWKEIKRWEQPFILSYHKLNPDYDRLASLWKKGEILPEETLEIERKTFWNFDEVKQYVKKHLGDVAVPYKGDVWSKDENHCIFIMRPNVK